MPHVHLSTAIHGWLDDDQIDPNWEPREPGPIWQAAAIEQPADCRSQPSAFAEVHRLLG